MGMVFAELLYLLCICSWVGTTRRGEQTDFKSVWGFGRFCLEGWGSRSSIALSARGKVARAGRAVLRQFSRVTRAMCLVGWVVSLQCLGLRRECRFAFGYEV